MRWILSLLIIILLTLQVRMWFGEGSFAQVVELTGQVELQKSRNDRLRERNRILEEEVLDLRNDSGAVEERARIDLGMIHNDETFYLVLDKPRKFKPAQKESTSPEQEARDVVSEEPGL